MKEKQSELTIETQIVHLLFHKDQRKMRLPNKNYEKGKGNGMKVKQGLSLGLAMALLLSGCTGTNQPSGESTRQTAQSGQTAQDSQEPVMNLRVYKQLHVNLQQYAAGNENLPMFQEIEKRTNTKITFMTPPVGQEKEQFNLIVASGDYPDIFVDMWLNYTGGGAKALKDKVIIPLNDLIDQNAPNIKAAMEQYPEAFRYVANEEGQIYGIPMVFTDNMQLVTWGVNLRKDWLDDLGFSVPSTVDEYYEVLKGFRDEKGAASPFTITLKHLKQSHFLAGAYGVSNEFYQENGQVKYGPAQPEYKEYLKTLNKWYEEGLLDRDFATIDDNTRGAKMLNGQSGMTWAPSKGGVGAWNQGLQEKDPNAQIIGAPYAGLVKGEVVGFGKINPEGSLSCTISSTCKDPVGAIRFLDYMFSEEGRRLLNFGIEGESYEMVDGEPVIMDTILKATDMPVLSKMNLYATSAEGNAGVATIVDQRYLLQINEVTPNVTEALETWATSSTFEHEIPGIIPLSEDSSRYASIMNEVETYADEMLLKFIMGQESIDGKYDEYIAAIEAKGIGTVTEIMQKAYDAFHNK